jgi:hypothetical protein
MQRRHRDMARRSVNQNAFLSRRAALGSLAASSLFPVSKPVAAPSSADAQLVSLGRDFDAAAAKLDHAIANGGDPHWEVLDELAILDAEIAATQAFAMEGLRVKARAACWALLGDLDPAGQLTTDKRMALSIARDLIRLYDPDLEHVGALKTLVEENEKGASRLPQGSSARPTRRVAL